MKQRCTIPTGVCVVALALFGAAGRAAQPPPLKFGAAGLTEPQRVKPGTTAVTVTFDGVPFRMIFQPPWLTGFVTEKNVICSPGYAETADPKNCDGPAEVQQDRDNRHARMWIERQSAARVVVRARAALCDKHGVIAHNDVPSGSPYGKGDWVDERFTIYPDGTHVRAVTVYTGLAPTAAAHWADGKPPFETQETIVLNSNGRAPTDDIDVNALTVIRMDGKAKTVSFKPYPAEGALLDGANIQVVNLNARAKPFTIAPDADPKIQAFRGPDDDHQHLDKRVFVGWPRGEAWGKRYTVSLSHVIDWKFHERGKNTLTAVTLSGMTTAATDAAKAADLVPLARSWLHPPTIAVVSEGGEVEGVDMMQKAFVLKQGAETRLIAFVLLASNESPLVNPAIVVRGWGDRPATVKAIGRPFKPGDEVRVGHEKHEGRVDLVVWMRMRSTRARLFSIK